MTEEYNSLNILMQKVCIERSKIWNVSIRVYFLRLTVLSVRQFFTVLRY